MTIIEIAALENGAHRNQTVSELTELPEGWAVIPDVLMDTWDAAKPFVSVTASDGVVTELTAGEAPPDEDEPEPDTLEQRISDIEDALIELAAIIAGEEE